MRGYSTDKSSRSIIFVLMSPPCVYSSARPANIWNKHFIYALNSSNFNRDTFIQETTIAHNCDLFRLHRFIFPLASRGNSNETLNDRDCRIDFTRRPSNLASTLRSLHLNYRFLRRRECADAYLVGNNEAEISAASCGHSNYSKVSVSDRTARVVTTWRRRHGFNYKVCSRITRGDYDVSRRCVSIASVDRSCQKCVSYVCLCVRACQSNTGSCKNDGVPLPGARKLVTKARLINFKY